MLSDPERDALVERVPDLLEFLAVVPDPRRPRGVRHRLASLPAVTVAAVVAGARSFTAVSEWISDASPQVMAALEVGWEPLARRFDPPGEATIRRVLEQVDAQAFDAAATAWPAARLPGPARRRILDVDGKSLRGTRHHTDNGRAIHLLSVLDQATSVTLRQVKVDGKSNEITALRPLLQPLDLNEAIITADAQHTRKDTADFLVTEKNAHYILIAKKNQPALYQQLKQLPWGRVRLAHTARDRGHGRLETRNLKIVTVESGLFFPHAAQAVRVTRTRRSLDGKNQTTGTGPQLMASIRNLAIAVLRLRGATNISAATRHHARDDTRILATLDLKKRT